MHYSLILNKPLITKEVQFIGCNLGVPNLNYALRNRVFELSKANFPHNPNRYPSFRYYTSQDITAFIPAISKTDIFSFMRLSIILLFLILYTVPRAAGQDFNAGLMPEFAVSYKWSDKIQQIIKIESLHEMYESTSPGFNYGHDQTDLQFFIQGTLNPFRKIAVGYQYRLENGSPNVHRFIQQAAFLQREYGFRIGHRLRTDQTIYVSDRAKFRFRYRLSAVIPLEGQSLDAGEFYLITSGEPIYSLQNLTSDLEIRFVGAIGFYINNRTKLEMGLDYRFEKLLISPTRQKLWLNTGLFYSI